jgi:hypothetical protein
MAIDVTCSGCKTRFKVSDKFAGQKGPCPKCKTVIQIPKPDEQVVVHEPESFGPKTTSGQHVLKPIFRQETSLSSVQVIGIIAAVVFVLIVALALRGLEGVGRTVALGIGSLLLAFPLVYAGYTFLRDDELEPYRGMTLWIRVAICAAVYALLWGLYAWVPAFAFHLEHYELFHLLFILPPVIAVGAFASSAALDLDFGTGLLHYALYLVATGALCLLVGAPIM